MGDIKSNLHELIHNKRVQATYQYLVFEGILNCVNDDLQSESINLDKIFQQVANMAVIWVKKYGMKLGTGESVVNKIIDEKSNDEYVDTWTIGK